MALAATGISSFRKLGKFMTQSIRLATRGSTLALAQTREVEGRLLQAWPNVKVDEKIFQTRGDLNLQADLATVGTLDKGLFTKELEQALREGIADAAVHSLKDLPTTLPQGLEVAAILPRADAADILVSRDTGGLVALNSGARIGTGSPRRRAMLLASRGDVVATPIRGNVPTRLAKLAEGNYEAIILAAAGLERLGCLTDGTILWDGRRFEATRLKSFLPAPGQGAIAVEARAKDERISSLLGPLHHLDTATAVIAERAVLAGLGGGCHMALGTRAYLEGDLLHLEAVVFDESGGEPKYAMLSGKRDHPETLGRALAEKLYGR
jgi:hydroxymethylbilane synthase